MSSPASPNHRVERAPSAPQGELGFRILPSADGASGSFIAPDLATCDACLTELFDPTNRRFRYPFINCTECGPRLTIVEHAPYDRERTTMRGFELCAACRGEYEDPASRRFHAQPNACPACGPELSYERLERREREEAALVAAVEALRDGSIVAVKGIGGYHLACVASDAGAVRRLRERKQRDQKPLALMVADVAMAGSLVELSAAAREQLLGRARPIVLCERRPGAPVAAGVAPGSPWLGVMLAYAPLQHLLLRELGEALVMTSGNVSDEPMAFDDADARSRLELVADAWLLHNRPIRTRCDDSVVRPLSRGGSVLRRARGLAPEPIALGRPLVEPLLALGAESNLTFALGRARHVFVSHHLGDAVHLAAHQQLLAALGRYEELFDARPRLIAHDLHPDYRTTALARRLATERGVATLAVQHHHAHIASVMLEHELEGPVLGVAFDGTGFGTDGTSWGGEFLLADRAGFERVAHLRAVPAPGGDRVVREPWRMAAAYLHDAGLSLEMLTSIDSGVRRAVRCLLERRAYCPPSSGAGRLFDAIAALSGIRCDCHYDGQPAIELEWAALRVPSDAGRYDFELARSSAGEPWVVDTRPLIRDVARDLRHGTNTGVIARRFHTTLGASVVATCDTLRREHGLSRVVLGGGVFANGLLVEQLLVALPERGFEVFRAERYPSGDGGLCLGQLAVAAAYVERAEARTVVA